MIIIQGFSLKGVDPDILKKLNGTEIPLLISFDGRPPVKLNSTFALLPSLLDKDVGLGYQFVSLTPFLHRQLKEGQTLLIQNIGEARSYRFSLSGAEAAIGKLMCLL